MGQYRKGIAFMLRRMFALISGLLTGCADSPHQTLPSNQPGSFTIVEVESMATKDGPLKTWRATSRTGVPPFTFLLELHLKVPTGPSSMAFGEGAILREPENDGTQFLKDVGHAIDAESDIPTQTSKLDRLEFSTAILGTSLSRESGDSVIAGSFTSSKPGNWIALKLFLADGEGEVFLNIDPVGGNGEFAVKDPDYGDVVVRELARVFLP